MSEQQHEELESRYLVALMRLDQCIHVKRSRLLNIAVCLDDDPGTLGGGSVAPRAREDFHRFDEPTSVGRRR